MSSVYQFKEGSQAIFKFLEMSPSPQGPKARQTYLTRTNVDGVSVYRDGTRGDLFRLATTADSENNTTGEADIKKYENRVGSVVEVHYKGEDYGDYLIHDVATKGEEILKLVGGLNRIDFSKPYNPRFFITAIWILFPLNK